jgi:AcrR family transcriptional regulator
MMRVQGVAVSLIRANGFDNVTVEEIAKAADVAPVSVYRYFGTKEGIVLWDQYDPPIVEEITRRLDSQSPFAAVRDALASLSDRLHDPQHDLERIQLVYREPSLRAAALVNTEALVPVLATILSSSRADMDRFEGEVLARSMVGVLIAAVDEWQATSGGRPLAEAIVAGFETLERAVCGDVND